MVQRTIQSHDFAGRDIGKRSPFDSWRFGSHVTKLSATFEFSLSFVVEGHHSSTFGQPEISPQRATACQALNMWPSTHFDVHCEKRWSDTGWKRHNVRSSSSLARHVG